MQVCINVISQLSTTCPEWPLTLQPTLYERWMISHENPNIRWFYLPKEGKMAVEDDASRVSNMERGRPSFQFCLNARAPPRAFFFTLAAQMPSTVRTARTPTDLNSNIIRIEKRNDERADRRKGGRRIKDL